MRRFSIYFRSLSLWAKLQTVVVVMLLMFHAWFDYRHGYSWVTAAIFLFAWVIGWLLMPLMVAYPRQTSNVLGAFGITVFAFYIFGPRAWWWRTLAAHFCREFVMWLDLSCSYWFISEMYLKQEQAVKKPERAVKNDDDSVDEFLRVDKDR